MSDYFEDDFDDSEEFTVQPMMILHSAVSNAAYSGLTTADLLICNDVANEEDDLITLDRFLRFDHAIDAQIRLMQIICFHYGRTLPPVVRRD